MNFTSRLLAAAVVLASGEAGAAGPTCIRSVDIDHTDRPNDRTLVFTMKDRAVYRSDLGVRCPGLAASIDGFTLNPTDPGTSDLCAGLATFRLNDMGQPTCIVGPLTRVK